MKFTRIEVENIFAYERRSFIDLTDCDDEKNIVVVRGRNGAGKTSLLNAIKLLFLGSQDETLRRVGYGGAPISVKHFVMGQPGRWFGVFNKVARSSGAPARVALEWTNGGRAFKAQRLFRLSASPNGFNEELEITVDGTPMKDPELILQQLLPSEVVPFFFFDGEQIQSIADAELGREQGEIERLLGLSFIHDLLREIDSYARDRRRAGMPDDVRVAIIRAEGAQREAEGRAEAAGRARIVIEDEILDQEREKRRVDVERNRLRTGISESDRRRMVGRIAVLKSQRETLANEIVADLPVEAPWLANLATVQRVFKILDDHLAGAPDASLSEKLHRSLSPKLIGRLAALDPSVELSDSQQIRFTRGLAETLEEFGVPAQVAPSSPLLASLSPRQLRGLRDQFLQWAERGPALVAAHADRLRLLRQVTNDQQQAQRDLDEAELTSDEARRRFEELSAELERIDNELRAKADKSAEYRVEEQRAQREAAEHADEVRRREAEYEVVSKKNRAYQKSLQARRALEDYRERRRSMIRAEVEDKVNEKIQLLLANSKLIRSVRLDDQFYMTYFDEREEPVARLSISAGMRQLVAISMLWALKEQAGRAFPVVIDTPLGRIDRENRTELMKQYFPTAGNPLVLLPTNSEFGDQGYDHIGHRVRRWYEIVNNDGDNAEIVEIAQGAV